MTINQKPSESNEQNDSSPLSDRLMFLQSFNRIMQQEEDQTEQQPIILRIVQNDSTDSSDDDSTSSDSDSDSESDEDSYND